MAKKVLYSVYDKKVGSYDDPRSYTSGTMAHRAFIAAFRDPGTNMLKEYPSDFSLVYIGGFDTETGKIDLDNTLVTSMEGTEAMHIAQSLDRDAAARNLEPNQEANEKA